ncbi:helix-turn-helix domain-containing protein [Paenibacillus sp. 481]|uniref:helix-turn-helix domain-containing protein n=1 Tax=Paenibacillus sp. 481 TaxID=2835869 RepID=UPI001E5C0C45|nr:helix-turn-helix transcriptional regulator [Paenibacillus sp. 481]UHA72158.1 helix-turn-helix transcriptional regulator [Paenibacillus sp. 481]
MSMGSLKYPSIGDLLRQRRNEVNVTLGRLQDITNINKGTISKIENGEVKQPEFSTIHPIAQALNISFEDTVTCYIQNEHRADVLYTLLQEIIRKQEEDPLLVSKVATKFLEAPRQDSYDAITKLYNTSIALNNSTLQLVMYEVIICYTRGHGVMPYLAKSLYQKYVIERNDFSRLYTTYETGKYILNYVDMLSPEERISLYFKLGIHAYTLQMYEESIDFCKNAIYLDNSDSEFTINAVGILQDAYLYLGAYDLSEKYLNQYRKYAHYRVTDNVRLVTAMLTAKRGNTELAIAQFQECLQNCKDDFIVHVVNQLLILYLEKDQLSAIGDLLQLDEKITAITYTAPLKRSELAHFYKLKGDYYARIKMKEHEDVVGSYLESAFKYAQVNDIQKERECMYTVFDLFTQNNQEIDMETVTMIKNFYTRCKTNSN